MRTLNQILHDAHEANSLQELNELRHEFISCDFTESEVDVAKEVFDGLVEKLPKIKYRYFVNDDEIELPDSWTRVIIKHNDFSDLSDLTTPPEAPFGFSLNTAFEGKFELDEATVKMIKAFMESNPPAKPTFWSRVKQAWKILWKIK